MKIDKNIFRVETKMGSGPGGQHKNRTYSCAVITHIPTGLSEKCEETRYKNKNIELAYERLVKRLQTIALDAKMEELNEKRKEAIVSQGVIRTYNYKRNEVKDHRTSKVANLKNVLDGKLDEIW